MKPARGFTLIEALVAAAVLGLGILGATSLTLHSLQANAASQQQRTALAMASTLIDCWRSGPVLCPASAALAVGGETLTDTRVSGTAYTVRAQASATGYAHLQALQVTVSWQPTGPTSSAASGTGHDSPLAPGAGQIDLFTRRSTVPVFVPRTLP